MKLEIGVATNIGNRRKNEDLPVILMPAMIVGVIDGMGGHGHGDVAAKLVHSALTCLQHIEEPNMETLVRAMLMAHHDVRRENTNRGTNMGAVATVAWIDIVEKKALVAHIGDTRAYIYRDNSLEQITTDHSVVARLPEETRIKHPEKNLVTRCFGTSRECSVDTYAKWFEPGEIMILCSDGLSDTILPGEIQVITARGRSAQETAQDLLGAVLASGHTNLDNTTIVVVRALEDENARNRVKSANPTCCPTD